MKVSVYWNLHKGLWSVLAQEGPDKGRVVARLPRVTLRDVTSTVRQGGRQKVLREGRKNVHAFINGRLVADHGRLKGGEQITYNPYKYSSFVYRDDPSREFKGSGRAILDADRSVTVGC